jgi:hypothetical protein
MEDELGLRGFARYAVMMQDVWPRPELTDAQRFGQALCGGLPEPLPPFSIPNLDGTRRATESLRRFLAEGRVSLRWYLPGWGRIIWLKGSAADLEEYQRCCELLPGGWELEKHQQKPVDGIDQDVPLSSYAAIFDPLCYNDGSDTTSLTQFLTDYAPRRKGDWFNYAPPTPWKNPPPKANALQKPPPSLRRSPFARLLQLFLRSGGISSAPSESR